MDVSFFVTARPWLIKKHSIFHGLFPYKQFWNLNKNNEIFPGLNLKLVNENDGTFLLETYKNKVRNQERNEKLVIKSE